MKKQLFIFLITLIGIYSCGAPKKQELKSIDTHEIQDANRIPPPPSWVGKQCKLKIEGPLAWLIPITGDILFTCTADKGSLIQVNNQNQDLPKDGFELKP